MHVLSIFNSWRKSSKSRGFHIRKVSFSECAISSGSDVSSSPASTLPSYHPQGPSSNRSTAFDPQALHSTFQAPPRLHDRPLLSYERRSFEDAPTVFYDSDNGVDEVGSDCFEQASEFEQRQGEFREEQSFMMKLPSHASPMDHGSHDRTGPQDYVILQPQQRPRQPRSRWSAPTAYTPDQMIPDNTTTADDDSDLSGKTETQVPEQVVAQQLRHLSMPNFRHRRETVVFRRPAMSTMDSLDDFIKRGKWKRRGIVFKDEDMKGARL